MEDDGFSLHILEFEEKKMPISGLITSLIRKVELMKNKLGMTSKQTFDESQMSRFESEKDASKATKLEYGTGGGIERSCRRLQLKALGFTSQEASQNSKKKQTPPSECAMSP